MSGDLNSDFSCYLLCARTGGCQVLFVLTMLIVPLCGYCSLVNCVTVRA